MQRTAHEDRREVAFLYQAVLKGCQRRHPVPPPPNAIRPLHHVCTSALRHPRHSQPLTGTTCALLLPLALSGGSNPDTLPPPPASRLSPFVVRLPSSPHQLHQIPLHFSRTSLLYCLPASPLISFIFSSLPLFPANCSCERFCAFCWPNHSPAPCQIPCRTPTSSQIFIGSPPPRARASDPLALPAFTLPHPPSQLNRPHPASQLYPPSSTLPPSPQPPSCTLPALTLPHATSQP